MKRLFLRTIALPLWASPNSSVYEMMLRFEDRSAVRRASALDPGFLREDPVHEPLLHPARPIPTDVPAPNPHDIQVRESIDVPLPDQGTPTKPDLKPRPRP